MRYAATCCPIFWPWLPVMPSFDTSEGYSTPPEVLSFSRSSDVTRVHAVPIKLAAIPDDIRGYGHIKDANLAKAKRKEAELLGQWRNPEAMKAAAE